MQLFYV